MPPTVSVVIPAYNARDWIRETVESVFQQTCSPADVELIIVDDASPDDTAEWARSLVRHRAISAQVVQCTQNRGVSAARNVGWNLARGEWIQFLDADDLLAPHKVELQMAAARQAPADVAVVYSNWQELCLIDDAWQLVPPVHELFVDDNPVVRILQDQFFGYVGPALIRKSALASIGGFNEACSLAEDLDCMLRLAMAGERFCRVDSDSVAFFYRWTPESLWKDAVRDVAKMRMFLGVFMRAEDFLRSRRADGWLSSGARVALVRRYFRWAPFYLEYDPVSFREITRRITRLGVE